MTNPKGDHPMSTNSDVAQAAQHYIRTLERVREQRKELNAELKDAKEAFQKITEELGQGSLFDDVKNLSREEEDRLAERDAR